jgi:hypothetical protein
MAVGSRGIARPRCTPPSLRRSSGRGRSPTFPSHVLVEQRPHSPSRQTAADHRRSRRRCRRASGRASSPTACRRRGPLPPARRKRDTLTVPLKPRFLQVLDDLRSPCRQAGPARRGPAQVTVRQAQPPVSPAVGPGPVPEFVTASVRAPVGAAVVRGGLSDGARWTRHALGWVRWCDPPSHTFSHPAATCQLVPEQQAGYAGSWPISRCRAAGAATDAATVGDA